jgi:hypothetical protein
MNQTTFRVEIPDEIASEQMIIARDRLRRYVRGCQNSIRLAVELNRRFVTPEIMGIPGPAAKNRIMLNHLVSNPKARYLQVGAGYGATFCSALAGNEPEYACVVDNFVGDQKKAFNENTKKFIKSKFDVFNRSDIFSLTKTQQSKLAEQKINTYMYTGPATEEDHFKAVMEYYDCLDDVFIIIVNDWNNLDARKGTFRGLQEKNVNVQWQIDLKATGSKDTREWWNGVWVAVCIKRK